MLTTWDTPAWSHIGQSASGPPTLAATLQAAAAVCDAAIALAPRVDGFDPATGWAALDGILAGLELATGTAPPPPPDLDTPPSLAAAATTVDMLLRDAADTALELAVALRDTGAAALTVRAVAGVVSQLSDTYTQIYARPW